MAAGTRSQEATKARQGWTPARRQDRNAMRVERGWPSVDVVIATRDRPDLLKRAVRSVVNQDYPAQIRLIVVFDQSPAVDDFGPLGDNRLIAVMQNGRLPGLAGARNTGILAA